MSEPFINKARERLLEATKLADRDESKLGVELDALCALAVAAIRAVEDDGPLPAHLCTAVVRYSRGGQ